MPATEDNPYADRWSSLPSRLNKPHPMAFEFITRSPNTLFFPTIHIHDGEVHKEANFDHHLYYQGDNFSNSATLPKEISSDKLAAEFMDITKTRGVVDSDQGCHAIVMSGILPNQDTVLATV